MLGGIRRSRRPVIINQNRVVQPIFAELKPKKFPTVVNNPQSSRAVGKIDQFVIECLEHRVGCVTGHYTG